MGMSPDEIAREYPHLTLAQVHAALACYHANAEEIESDIAQEGNGSWQVTPSGDEQTWGITVSSIKPGFPNNGRTPESLLHPSSVTRSGRNSGGFASDRHCFTGRNAEPHRIPLRLALSNEIDSPSSLRASSFSA
jgi:hypothetical protein